MPPPKGSTRAFDEGDAEALPYADASFDVVATIFGAMFAPRPELVAAELVRVCRPGGTIAMANWTKEGFIGQMFKTIARFIAPPGMPSPVLWGDEAVVRERFGAALSDLRLTRVNYRFDYRSGPPTWSSSSAATTVPRRARSPRWARAERGGASRATRRGCGRRTTRPPNRRARTVDAEYLEVVGVRA